MLVQIDLSALRTIKKHEYAIRFLLGGCITAATGLIAKEYGAMVGGIFLGFPAIFPAAATLIEKHETEKKRRHGLSGVQRGRLAAGVDAAGAALGSIGLLAFAAVFWELVARTPACLALVLALAAWAMVAGTLWILRKKFHLWH